jgi:hypothetical protein
LRTGWAEAQRLRPVSPGSYAYVVLEEPRLALWLFAVEVFIGAVGGYAATGRAIEHADLHEIGLVHFLDGIFFLAEGSGQGAQTDGTTSIFIEQGDHEVAVDFVEAVFIDAEHVQGFTGDFAGDAATCAHFGEITRASKKAIGDARRSTAASGDFFSTSIVHLNVQNFGGAVEDDEQIFRFVKIEAMHNAEARTKRRGDESGTGGGADEREMIQVEGMNARARPLSDDEIDAKVFHGRVKNFLDGGLQAMNFVEKENLLGLKRGEYGREVSFAFEKRTSAGFYGDVELVGDDLSERGFSESRRAIEKNVIERFAAIAGGFEGDGDIFLDALLTDVFGESFGADAGVQARVIVREYARNEAWRMAGVLLRFLGSEVRHSICQCSLSPVLRRGEGPQSDAQ